MIVDRPAQMGGIFDFILKPILIDPLTKITSGLQAATVNLQAQETQRVQAIATAEAQKQIDFNANLKRYITIGAAALGGLVLLGLIFRRRD